MRPSGMGKDEVANFSDGLFGQGMTTICFKSFVLGWTEIVHENPRRRRR